MKITITALFISGTVWAFGQTDNGRTPQLNTMSAVDTSGKKVIRKKPELMEVDTTTKKSSSAPVSSSNDSKPVLAPIGISTIEDKKPK